MKKKLGAEAWALLDEFGMQYLDLPKVRRRLLQEDVRDLAQELGQSPLLAARELSRRIGGADNLAGYAASLRVGRQA